MSFQPHRTAPLALALALAMATSSTHANTTAPEREAKTPSDTLVHNEQKTLDDLQRHSELNQEIKQSEQALQEAAAEDIAGDDASLQVITPDSTPEEIYAHLEQNPDAFENLLLRSISIQDTQALQALLPAYEKYANKDQSVIDWGNALIALRDGDTKKAVDLYRKINAALPNIRLLRLQLASALYQNRQVNAAKDELEKLRREDISESERAELDRYIEAINRLDKWNFNANLSFERDTNLEDAPPVGTKIGDQHSSLTYTTPHQSGTGFSYGTGVDKKWSYDNNFFTSFSSSVNGTYYWDNKKYNDLYLSTNVGIGYQTATAELELSPNITKSWYGGGVNGTEDNDKLKAYTLSKGITLSGSKWLNNNLLYQHSTRFSKIDYEKPYQNNDGKIYAMNNGFFYSPNARQYYTAHWNISKKDGKNPADSFKRSGLTVSWGNTWDKGFSTLASIGAASKKYQGQNFAGIKRHNYEYNLGLSVWKRDFSIFGLTPKLNLNHKTVTSNYAFDVVSESGANVVLSKTF